MKIIKARFDQIVGWHYGDEVRPEGPEPRCYHYTIGSPGGPISGGLYIKIDNIIPDSIVIKIPQPHAADEPKESRPSGESTFIGQDCNA